MTSLVRWPLDSFAITQGFHGINAEFSYEHWGTDLAANEGVEIKAPESGVITAVNSGWKPGGYFGGNYVKMTGDSGYSHYMGHMSSTAAIAGKRVNQGEVIGKVGSTGQATGPHVHFEMYRGGSAVDPEKIIKGGNEVNQEEIDKLWKAVDATNKRIDALFNGKDGVFVKINESNVRIDDVESALQKLPASASYVPQASATSDQKLQAIKDALDIK